MALRLRKKGFAGVGGRGGEARDEFVLFLGAEDAAREAREVVAGSGYEAGDSWDVYDVGADVEGEGEGEGFHCCMEMLELSS